MQFKTINSPNFSKKVRKISNIKFVIFHYTGMQSKRVSLERLLSKKYKVSCHYFIDRDGEIIKMVEDNKIAWHAGKSRWGKFQNLNKYSLGIELHNKGHKFGYQFFTKPQISKLVKLCLKLKKKYKIKQSNFLGHSDIAPLRKTDPGEKFPWQKLNKKGLGLYSKNLKKNFIKKKLSQNEIRKKFFFNLHSIGYRYFDKKRYNNKKTKLLIRSFQRRFRTNKVNGVLDLECLKISQNLVVNSKI